MLSSHYIFSPEMEVVNLHPRFWCLDCLTDDPQIGLPDLKGNLVFPEILNLSSEKLERTGVYLLENGMEIFIWIGRNTPTETCSALFGVESPSQINSGKAQLPALPNDKSVRLQNLITNIRNLRMKTASLYPHLYLVREDGEPNMRIWFLSHLIEDRLDNQQSYPQFLASVREKLPKINN